MTSIYFNVFNGVKKPVAVSSSVDSNPFVFFRSYTPTHKSKMESVYGSRFYNQIDIVKNFILSSIQEAPDELGLPIDILIITKSGKKWIQKKKNCN
jgi:hypothetical protein